MKAKVTVTYELDLDITRSEAARNFPDSLWPVTALALDHIAEKGLSNLVKEQSTTAKVEDVVAEYD